MVISHSYVSLPEGKRCVKFISLPGQWHGALHRRSQRGWPGDGDSARAGFVGFN